jgi:hypothetical protein
MLLIDPISVQALTDRFPRSPGPLRHHLAAEGITADSLKGVVIGLA